MSRLRSHSALLAGSIALLATAACGGGEATRRDASDTARSAAAAPPPCPGDNAGLTMAPGFCASIFADSVGNARHIVVAGNGDVYVTLETAPAPPGGRKSAPASFVALRDTTKDGRADVVVRGGGRGNTGIALFNGYLYVDEGKRLVRYARADSQLAPASTAEVVVRDLPFQPGHRARNFVIAGDGSLYVNVGSATNSCQTKDRAAKSPGHDPCTELLTRAGIWRFDATTPNQRFAAGARFATGIRNAMGLAIGGDEKLYATQHGRDQLHDSWADRFSTTYQAENPAEELLQVNAGDDFGWPYCYFAVDTKSRVTAPEYGGDGKKADRCGAFKAPAASFPGHWAPMSLLFYRGGMLPGKYEDGAFIAFHGSWNRLPEPQAGYRIVFQPLASGAAQGAYETIADGFAGMAPDKVQPDAAKHRPVGLATGPDGALYISDDAGGRIYRVTYNAGR